MAIKFDINQEKECCVDFLSFYRVKYAVPQKFHTHPMGDRWKFQGGGGVLKVKILEAKYEA